MKKERINSIIKSKKIYEVYYKDEPIWIQELNNNIATIGFLKSAKYENVNIIDLHE